MGLTARSNRAGITSAANAPTPAFLSQLAHLVNNSEAYPDVWFLVEGRRVAGHRALLAARCPLFHAMFGSGMRESRPDAAIELPDTPHDAFVALLHFTYTDTLAPTVTPAGAVELYSLADRFTLDRLKLLCERKFVRSLAVDNAAPLLAACDAVDPGGVLKGHAVEYIVRNFDAVVKTPTFRDVLSRDLILEVLARR
jgi:speckle-type POZ protein